MQRNDLLAQLSQAFRSHSMVALLGPRQGGKTTLARSFVRSQNQTASVEYFDLEDPTDLARLATPKLTFSSLSGLIVIDEIQRMPELFPILRVLVDEPEANRQFLILGSASRDLIRQSSETLAGRINYIELTPFSYNETHDWQRLWIKGGFPRSYLAATDSNSNDWRKAYISTYLEQDIPNLGIRIPAQSLRRFWMMLAHYHANIFNASEIGRSLGVADTTIRRYLDILTGTFMIRQLQPWQENIKKRQVKSPKIYFRDSGIFHSLLGITDKSALLHHPKLGASWEGAALEEVIRFHKVDPGDCYFWATHNQAELDLLIFKNGKRLGFEFKFTDAPKITSSMRSALEHLSLDELAVLYPGKKDFMLSEDIKIMGIENYLNLDSAGCAELP